MCEHMNIVYATLFHAILLHLFTLMFKTWYVLLSSAELSDLSQLQITSDMENTPYPWLHKGTDPHHILSQKGSGAAECIHISIILCHLEASDGKGLWSTFSIIFQLLTVLCCANFDELFKMFSFGILICTLGILRIDNQTTSGSN